MARKSKTLRPIHANRGVEVRYRKTLDSLIAEMIDSVEYWLKAAYRKTPPKMASVVEAAQDASPARAIQKALRDLGKRWTERFDDMAAKIAERFARDSFKASDSSMRAALKEAGWAVEFKMTPAMRDALDATITENVGLIKSIPAQYLQEVEGIVMRSYATGRDLDEMVKRLRTRYGVTQRRATLIARDQSNKANAVVNRARQLELGITRAVWHHSHAGKTPRPDHVAANGKEYDIAQGCLISGEYILPGQMINCRCTSRAVLPLNKP